MCDDESTASETSSLDVTSCIDLVTPAVLSWRCGDNKAALLKRITFTIRRDGSTVLFRLRADVTFKASSPPKTHLFFFIPPESLRSLILDQSATDAYGPTIKQWEEATRELGSVYCLRFELGGARKAMLVGPKLSTLATKNTASGRILNSLQSLTSANSFTIYISQKVLLKAQLASVCEAVSNQTLKSPEAQPDLASLYRGKGGQVIQLSPVTASSSHDSIVQQAESPPSYDELAPSPPALFGTSESNKRRRVNSESPSATAIYVEKICRKMLDDQRAELLNAMDHRASKLQGDMKAYVREQLNELEERIHTGIRDEVLPEFRQEISEMVDDDLDDKCFGLQIKLEDFVKDELKDTEESILDMLDGCNLDFQGSGSLQLNLSR